MGLFIICRSSLFTIHYFLAHYSLLIIIKGRYSLIIIPHPDPRTWDECVEEGGVMHWEDVQETRLLSMGWVYRIGLVLFDLILYVPSTIYQLNRDSSSWVEPVLS